MMGALVARALLGLGAHVGGDVDDLLDRHLCPPQPAGLEHLPEAALADLRAELELRPRDAAELGLRAPEGRMSGRRPAPKGKTGAEGEQGKEGAQSGRLCAVGGDGYRGVEGQQQWPRGAAWLQAATTPVANSNPSATTRRDPQAHPGAGLADLGGGEQALALPGLRAGVRGIVVLRRRKAGQQQAAPGRDGRKRKAIS